MYVLTDNEDKKVRDLQNELTALETVVLSTVEDSSKNKQPYSLTQESLEATQARLKEIEDEQIYLGERLERIEKDDDNARQKVNIYINKLHTIKRYMEKRNLPGIPKSLQQGTQVGGTADRRAFECSSIAIFTYFSRY